MDGFKSVDVLANSADDHSLESCPQCLYCGSKKWFESIERVGDIFFDADPGLFDFHRCGDCGSLWLAERPTGERLLRAYSNYYTHGTDAGSDAAASGLRGWVRAAYFRSRFTNAAAPLDRLVGKLIDRSGYDTTGLDRGMRFVPAPPAKVLDYGCGSGKFLLRLQPLNYELHGAEYDPHLLAMLSDVGIAIHNVAALADDSWDREFDHITLSHVLEHVPDPVPLLKRLCGWLKPGGTLYLELPNADATGLAIFGRNWRGLEAPRHFALPSRAALAAALEGNGFIVERQQIDRSVRSWMWNVSLSASPEGQRDSLRQAMSEAPPETEANAEFLTILARRPT
jgi:2-polyprenyl-3-methyl-5-hydroxy-6-metoxy-1,4-benzoquinol methylase